MKRVMLAAAFCAAFFAIGHSRAQAAVEFCAARLEIHAVGVPGQKSDAPAALYGFDLTALVPRQIAATLAFDTSAGWFTVDVPQTAIVAKDRQYDDRGGRFKHQDAVSPVMYVRFPQPVTLNHRWVYEGNGVACPPPPAAAKGAHYPPQGGGLHLDDSETAPLSAPPSPSATVLTVKQSAPLEAENCKDAFRDATIREISFPAYPTMARELNESGRVIVTVALNADGSVADAWLFASPGDELLDKAALDAAKATTYQGARSYCLAVPATYRFVTTFDPN